MASDLSHTKKKNCRLCLSEDSRNQINIFTNKLTEEISYCNIIKLCLNLESSTCDGLPEIICSNCKSNLINFYEFKLKSNETVHKLKVETRDESDVQMDSAVDEEKAGKMNMSDMTSNGTSSSSPVDMERPTLRQQKVFNCKFCCKIYKTKKETQNHINREHPKTNEYKCFYCDELFHTSTHYQRHVKLQESIDKTLSYYTFYTCHICRIIFKIENDYIIHNAVKHPDLKFFDEPKVISDKETNESTAQNKAVEKQSASLNISDEPYKCSECSVSYFEMRDLKYHILTHLTEFTCPIQGCEMEYDSITYLRLHLFENKHKTNQCANCKAVFNSPEELEQHKSIKCLSNKFHCVHCDQYFSSEVVLAQHKRSVYKIKFNCDGCKKTFDTSKRLSQHYRVHPNMKPYKCKNCKKSYKSFITLYHHMDLHKAERSYICYVCDRKFQTRKCLGSHVIRHKGKKFACSTCNSVFTNHTQLMVHRVRGHK